MDRREQEAMTLASKGQLGPAIVLLEQLVAEQPNDWRSRGRLADLYLKESKPVEAERHLRTVGSQMMKDGQYRPAVAIFKQLVKLKPNDGELVGSLGECQHHSRFINDARKCYVEAMTLLAQKRPRQAAHYAQKLLEIAPEETPVRVRHAELLEAAGEKALAVQEYKTLATQAAAKGRPNDRARFLEKVLLSFPSDYDALLGAAEARIAMKEPRLAFPHLQKAYAQAKESLPVMQLLAQAFEAVDQGRKARQVWLECARTAARNGDTAVHKRALEQALRLQPDDERIREELEALGGKPVVKDLAVLAQPWAQPTTADETAIVARADVEARYGFPDRAIQTLRNGRSAGVAVAIALGERLAEAGDARGALGAYRAITLEDPVAAPVLAQRAAQLQRIAGDAGPSAVGHEPVEEPDEDPITQSSATPSSANEPELMQLEGELESIDDDALEPVTGPLEPADESPSEGSDEDSDDVADESSMDSLEGLGMLDMGEALGRELDLEAPAPEPDEGPVASDAGAIEAEGDRFAREGRTSEAMAAYRKALGFDPSNEQVLMKIGELLSGNEPATPAASKTPLALPAALSRPEERRPPPLAPEPPVRKAPARAPLEVDPEPSGVELSLEEPDVATAKLDVTDDQLRILQARAWMSVFQYRDAIEAVHGVGTLEAAALRSDCKRQVGLTGEGCASLQMAVSEASEDDPAYKEALWVLAGLYLSNGKSKTAKRLLIELEGIDPTYRTEDVTNRLRGIGLLERTK